VHILKRRQQALPDLASDANFVVRRQDRLSVSPQRVMPRHPPWVRPAGRIDVRHRSTSIRTITFDG
jgi:hypothetical protein